jgi:hypothetical protein
MVNNFNSRKQYEVSAVEKHCVVCEVRTLCQDIMSVIVKFLAVTEEIVQHTLFHIT